MGQPMTELRHRLGAIARRFGLSSVYAFGSRAQEFAQQDAGPLGGTADVHIGVQPHPGRALSTRDRVPLATELEDLLSAPRVDLVVLPDAEPFLALEAIRGELLYCADPDAQAEQELFVLRRAGDGAL